MKRAKRGRTYRDQYGVIPSDSLKLFREVVKVGDVEFECSDFNAMRELSERPVLWDDKAELLVLCDRAGSGTSNEASRSGPLLLLLLNSRCLCVLAGSTRCGREIAVVMKPRTVMRDKNCMVGFLMVSSSDGEIVS